MIHLKEKDLISSCWPVSRLGEAVEILVRKAGYRLVPESVGNPPDWMAEEDQLDGWLDFLGDRLGVEIEPVVSSFGEFEKLLKRVAPALIQIPGHQQSRFLAVVKRSGRHLLILEPSLKIRRVALLHIYRVFLDTYKVSDTHHINEVFSQSRIPDRRRKTAFNAILQELAASQKIRVCWMIRPSPAMSFGRRLLCGGVHRSLILMIATHVIAQGFMLLAWWVIGKAVFSGHVDWVWFWAWSLAMATAIPLQIATRWAGNDICLQVGLLLRQRLMFGALNLESQEIRHQGAGQFLGKAMEIEVLDAMALGGGFLAVVAIVELLFAAWVLSKGIGGVTHCLMLLLWMLFVAVICLRYYRRSEHWVNHYQSMTNDLVERMVGHRTRLAQEDYQRWHIEEDRLLNQYLNLSTRMDRSGIKIDALISYGWLLMGLSGVLWAFVLAPVSKPALAISLGGVLMSFVALRAFSVGIFALIEAKNAWNQIRSLFSAASRPKNDQEYPIQPIEALETGTQPVLTVNEISYRYKNSPRYVLRDCCIRINENDRLLLEGPSGGGKSTLAGILSGTIVPDSGLLLLHGLDRQTLGTAEWRRRIVMAPQFHENHVLTETLAFNLLMGRRWPPSGDDIQEAYQVCEELGLGDLIREMPAGLRQIVGESGWRLSHGERSRLFIARAVLQKADLIILDESFAALDPENLEKALTCVLNRAKTLLVIAHP